MAKLGERKAPVGDRLSDRVSLGVLTQVFPADIVDRVIDETGTREQRVRLLPARVTVYFVLALCLISAELRQQTNIHREIVRTGELLSPAVTIGEFVLTGWSGADL